MGKAPISPLAVVSIMTAPPPPPPPHPPTARHVGRQHNFLTGCCCIILKPPTSQKWNITSHKSQVETSFECLDRMQNVVTLFILIHIQFKIIDIKNCIVLKIFKLVIKPYKRTYLQEEPGSVPDPDCPFVWSRKCGDVTDSVAQTILRPFPDWPDCSTPIPSPDGKDTGDPSIRR